MFYNDLHCKLHFYKYICDRLKIVNEILKRNILKYFYYNIVLSDGD